jgi:hypothetical protein
MVNSKIDDEAVVEVIVCGDRLNKREEAHRE